MCIIKDRLCNVRKVGWARFNVPLDTV